MPKETIELFKSDFKLVAEYLYQIKNEDENYMPSAQEIKHVEDTMNLLKAFGSNEISLEAYNKWSEKKKEKTIMRDLLAETIIRAKNEAAAEAEVIGSIKTYRECGVSDSEVKERIIKRFTLSNSQADEYLAQVVGK